MKRQCNILLTILLLATAVLTVLPGNAGATESVYDAISQQQHMQNGGSTDSHSLQTENLPEREALLSNQNSVDVSQPSDAQAPLPSGENPEQTSSGQNEQQGEEASLSFQKDNHTWLFIEALLKLVLATGVIIAIIYFGAKLIQLQRGGAQQHQNMQTIGVHALGQNKTMQIVRIVDKIYIIGVGENIQLIKELSDEESQKMIEKFQGQFDQLQQSNGLANQFDRIFKNKLSEFKNRNESAQHDSDNQRTSL